MNHIIQSAIDTRDKLVSGIAKLIIKLLDEDNDFAKLVDNVDFVMSISEDAKVSSMFNVLTSVQEILENFVFR